jgi:hypothetical protein
MAKKPFQDDYSFSLRPKGTTGTLTQAASNYQPAQQAPQQQLQMPAMPQQAQFQQPPTFIQWYKSSGMWNGDPNQRVDVQRLYPLYQRAVSTMLQTQRAEAEYNQSRGMTQIQQSREARASANYDRQERWHQQEQEQKAADTKHNRERDAKADQRAADRLEIARGRYHLEVAKALQQGDLQRAKDLGMAFRLASKMIEAGVEPATYASNPEAARIGVELLQQGRGIQDEFLPQLLDRLRGGAPPPMPTAQPPGMTFTPPATSNTPMLDNLMTPGNMGMMKGSGYANQPAPMPAPARTTQPVTQPTSQATAPGIYHIRTVDGVELDAPLEVLQAMDKDGYKYTIIRGPTGTTR